MKENFSSFERRNERKKWKWKKIWKKNFLSIKEKAIKKQKINNAVQILFLKKVNNIDKHLARMINIKVNNHTQIINIKNNYSLQTFKGQKGNIANNL